MCDTFWIFLLSGDDLDCMKTVLRPLHNVVDSIFKNFVNMCVADHVRVLCCVMCSLLIAVYINVLLYFLLLFFILLCRLNCYYFSCCLP